MTISNRISLEELRCMPIGDMAALPAEQLALLQDEAGEALRLARTACDWLDGAVALKYGDQAQEARRAEGKNTGTIRLQDGTVTVIADLPKRVDWDQNQLSDLVERIKSEGEAPRDYVEVSLKVSERKYASWPSHIRSLFEPARTVRTGKETFHLILEREGV